MNIRKSIILLSGLFLLILLLAIPADVGFTSPSKSKGLSPGTNHALIIGISKYKHWSNLISPVKDAEILFKTLTQKYNFKRSNVTLLTDKTKNKPTLVNILTSLGKYVSELTDNDNLLVFFAGRSAEDDDGETYWIPTDGQKKSKITWLKHSQLCAEIFTSKDFKAKNLLIIADSPFSGKLVRTKAISLTPYDLRYEEKIKEKASRKSRAVIAFGDQHWPADKSTDNLGLFAYYINKALVENELEIIDFENLIFDENTIFSITKIAGTKMLRGRMRTPFDKRGQFVVARLAPASIVNILKTAVSPEKGYRGDFFKVEAKTSAPANEVYLEIGKEKYLMEGSGSDWQYNIKIDNLGKTDYRVVATNTNDMEGKAQPGRIFTIKRRAATVNVKEAGVTPQKGLGGDKYHFTAITDTSAKKVSLVINGKRFNMTGSGTGWSLDKKIDIIGSVKFTVIAFNEDGISGSSQKGNINIEAGISNVLEAKATPSAGYAGEEFTINVKTDRIAKNVYLEMDGNKFAMKGTGSRWYYKKMIPEIGTKKFTIIAENIKGETGRSKSGRILTKKSPLPIPNIASIGVKVVGPGKGYPGDNFAINVDTTAPSDTVYVDLEGKKYKMDGSGTKWKYVARIDRLGINKLYVTAKNKDGASGKSKEDRIITVKKPAAVVNVVTASVNPLKGNVKRKFTFNATTDRPAGKVTLILGKKRYEMSGSGVQWSLSKKINETGTLDFSVVAGNEDGVAGGIKTASVTVLRKRYKYNRDGTVTDLITGKTTNRFLDNGDGTVTDLVTSLMWLKQPKQIAVTWNNAVEYCRNLKKKGYTGWRLPTIAELQKLVDRKQKSPALPPNNPFTGIMTHLGYWSKTKHKFGPKYVYQMNFWYGKRGYQKKVDDGLVWPVRYAEISDQG